MRVIKALVAFMGVLIVVGVALVVYGLSRQDNQTETSTVADTAIPSAPIAGEVDIPALAAPQSGTSFGEIELNLAAGERLVDFTRQGGEITLRIAGPDGSRLVIVSLSGKAVLGQVRINKAPE